MSEKSKNECGEKYKKIKNQNGKNPKKNVFDQNFTKNEFWGPKLQLSEPPRTRKHQKSCVNNNASIFQPKNPKTY